MADNLAITAGSGTTIGTDDVSGVHIQKVKLIDGTVDSSTTIPGSANGLQVAGQVAADAAMGGNPVAVGGKAYAPNSAAPTAMTADADMVPLIADRVGVQYVHPHGPNVWDANANPSAAQTDQTLKAAPGAGLSLYITHIVISMDGACTVTIEESTNVLKFKYYGAGIGDGVAIALPNPIRITANTLVSYTTTGAVNVFVGIGGYTAP